MRLLKGSRLKKIIFSQKIYLTIISICNIVPNMKVEDSNFNQMKEKELELRCREHGLSLTIQRRAVLEELARRTDHPTADHIYDEIKQRMKGVSRTTIYRVLETLVNIGVAIKVSNPEAKARFDADTGRHHHMTCLFCGAVIDVHSPELNMLHVPEQVSTQFDIIDYSVNFTGRCTKCRLAMGNANNDISPKEEQDEIH